MRFSVAAFWLAAALTVGSAFFTPRWERPAWRAVLTFDPLGYYAYLPSVFIYGDVQKMAWIEPIEQKHGSLASGCILGTPPKKPENRLTKYSSGLAVMEMPFFLAAHALARPLGFDADGFSKPYQMAVAVGGLSAAIVGLFFLRRFLRRFFGERRV